MNYDAIAIKEFKETDIQSPEVYGYEINLGHYSSKSPLFCQRRFGVFDCTKCTEPRCIEDTVTNLCTCVLCNYTWTSFLDVPKICSRCKSSKWNK